MEHRSDPTGIVEIVDERSPLAREAVKLVREAIRDVQPTTDLLSEIEERRRGLPSGGDYHLFVLLAPDGAITAAAAGAYLEAVNAGFVTYLAVREDQRGAGLGRRLRRYLVDAFRADARAAGGAELAYTAGEIRSDSPWLRMLVRAGGVIPFDLPYFHPWLPRSAEGRYVLYREPVADRREELPSRDVLKLLYTIWRRAYRIDFPLQSDTFCYMLDQVESRRLVGAARGFS